MTSEVVKSISIANLVNQRKAFFEEAERLMASIERMNELGKEFSNQKSTNMFGKFIFDRWIFRNAGRGGNDLVTAYEQDDPIEQIRLNVDRHIWSYLMDESGMFSFMDNKARLEWDEQLHGKEVPRVTMENIEATFGQLHAGRSDIFERGVINVFKSLSWNFKTNSPCCFGKRIIMQGVITTWGSQRVITNWSRPDYRSVNELQDLERCLTILDGRPEPDHRNSAMLEWASHVQGASVSENEWECDLFHFRWFKKGTLHVTFKRLDLVDEMNGIIAKHYPGALPERL